MRDINKVIIHCTATPEGREHNVADIRRWHLARGWSDIGYHYLIKIDGSIQEGRPISRSGAHCSGENTNSIGVVYVGGMSKDMTTAKDTRTAAQKQAFGILLWTLKSRHKGITIHGHNEFSSKACPSFDVKKEYGEDNN